MAYMEVESDGTIFTNRHFNSAGGMSTVTRNGAVYVVRIPGLGAAFGHVQVSGADGVGSRCKVVNWGPDVDLRKRRDHQTCDAGSRSATRR